MKHTRNTTVHNNTRNKKMRGKIVTLGFIIASMVITYLPRNVIGLATVISGPNNTILNIRGIFQFLVVFDPLFNPIIYVISVKEYREGFRLAARKICKTKPNAVTPTQQASR